MAQVYGIHQLELAPDADRAEFERRMVEEFIPKIQWPGWGAALVRADRGPRQGKYALVYPVDTIAARDAMFPSADSEDQLAAWEQAHPDCVATAVVEALGPMMAPPPEGFSDYVVVAATSQQERNKELVRRFNEEAWNQGRIDAVDRLLAPKYTDSDYASATDPRQALKESIISVRTAFPDMRIEPVDLVAEGDMVMGHWRFRGTQRGSFQQVPPTGKVLTLEIFTKNRIVDELIVSEVSVNSWYDFLVQLGKLPAEQPAQVS